MTGGIEQDETEPQGGIPLDLANAILDAMKAGDKEAEAKLWPLFKGPPHSLMSMKRSFGADFIRRVGFNTERADKEYGPGWLDE